MFHNVIWVWWLFSALWSMKIPFIIILCVFLHEVTTDAQTVLFQHFTDTLLRAVYSPEVPVWVCGCFNTANSWLLISVSWPEGRNTKVERLSLSLLNRHGDLTHNLVRRLC